MNRVGVLLFDNKFTSVVLSELLFCLNRPDILKTVNCIFNTDVLLITTNQCLQTAR